MLKKIKHFQISIGKDNVSLLSLGGGVVDSISISICTIQYGVIMHVSEWSFGFALTNFENKNAPPIMRTRFTQAEC